MMNKKVKKALALSFVYLMLALMYLPILVLIIFSFTQSKTMGAWEGFSLELYFQLINDAEILTATSNTLFIALTSSLLATFIGTISAVGIYYLRRAMKATVNTISQITVINADIVTGVAFMLFFLAIRVVPDGFVTLIIAHTVITIPYVIMSVLPRLNQLNPNLYEAGLDLGASPIRTLLTVVLPQLIPSMISGFALAFTLSLDDFVITKFNNGSVETISTYLYNKIRLKGVKPVLRALSSVIFIIVLAILLVINIASRKRAKKNFGK